MSSSRFGKEFREVTLQATGSVTWVVGAQASVLGRCGAGGSGGVLYPSSSSSSSASSGRLQGLGVVRCCAQVQEKKPRVRKTKEERREMVESFVNTYRVSNNGKFPSVNLTHKEVGGSYYIVREIVRDIIQENRVLGPGDLNAKALSFEDCPDSSELSARHELDQYSVEILSISDEDQHDKDSVLEMSGKEEIFSIQNNVISNQQLMGSSDVLEDGFVNDFVQNGNVGAAAYLEKNLDKQDEAPYEKSREIATTSSEEQSHSFAHFSDLHKEIELDSSGGAHEGTTSSITDEATLLSESSSGSVSQTNGALLHEHVTLPDDRHDAIANGAVDEANLCSETNGVLQKNQTLLQEHEVLSESIMIDDVHLTDGQLGSTTSANQIEAFNLNASPGKVVSSKSIDRHDEVEQAQLDSSPSEQDKSEGLASQRAVDTKGLLQREGKQTSLEEDASEFKKSVSGVTQEEGEASNAKHEHGISTTTAIGRGTRKAHQKKDDNLFWLIVRAFVVSMSKLWAK